MTAVPRALHIGLQVPARGTRPAGQQLLERPKRIRPTITAMGIGVEVQLAHQPIALFVLFTVRRMGSEGLLKRVEALFIMPSGEQQLRQVPEEIAVVGVNIESPAIIGLRLRSILSDRVEKNGEIPEIIDIAWVRLDRLTIMCLRGVEVLDDTYEELREVTAKICVIRRLLENALVDASREWVRSIVKVACDTMQTCVRG